MASRNYFEETDKGYNELVDTLNEIDDGDGVTIGVHAKDNDPASSEGEIGLAGLLSVHELGAYIEGTAFGDIEIPARPVLRPAVTENERRINDQIGDALESVLEGRMSRRQMWMRVGAKVVGYAQQRFGDESVLAPLADATIQNRRKGSSAPLLDTGNLKQSIDFVVQS
jgi:hypothetical protein